MFSNDNPFANRKVSVPTTPITEPKVEDVANAQTLQDSAFSKNGGSSFGGSDSKFKISFKSTVGVALIILAFVSMLGIDRVISDRGRPKKERNKKTELTATDFVIDDSDIEFDAASMKRDVESFRKERGFFKSLLCGGYRQSSFCK